MPSLKQTVEGDDSRLGHGFQIVVQTLIVVSLISFSIDTLPDLSATTQRFLEWVETVTVILFTIEYLLRLLVADSKPRFIFSFFGMIDLVAILPFYLASGLDLRAVRALRLLRVLKFFRYNKSLDRLKGALMAVRDDLIVFFSGAAIVLYLAGVGIYFCEHAAQPERFKSVFDGMWWALVTLTTVGYGDVYPVTAAGKIFTGLIMIVGLGIVAVPTGLIASALTRIKDIASKDS